MSRQFFIDTALESPTRFDLAKFMRFENGNFDPLTSRFFVDVKRLSLEGFFVISGEEARPDSISFKVYGDDQYWWVIMIYNDIFNVEQLRSGTSITYPSLQDIEDVFFSMRSLESAAGA